MKIPNDAKRLFLLLFIPMLLQLGQNRGQATSGFSVNGGAAQTGYVFGQGVCCGGDSVTASGTFAGAYAKNPGNTYYPEFVLISSNSFITSPGSQPYVTNTGTFTGSDSSTYTNFNYYPSLCYFSAGCLTNYGWLNYSNVNTAPGNSTFLNAYDGQIGTAPGVTGNFNRNYYWGNGVYLNDANVKYWGGPVNVLNGMTNNPNAMITAVVNGTNQVNVAGLNVSAWYGDSTMAAITEANYGTIAGSYTGSYNGTAAGIYNFTDYGGMNITNAASGIVTAKAPYYADGIYAWCQYGNLNLVQNGLVTGTATGGQNGNTTGIGDAVGMDLFTYSTTNTASINLLNTGTVTANATAYTNLYSVAVFCWAEGGSFTFTNTGTLTIAGAAQLQGATVMKLNAAAGTGGRPGTGEDVFGRRNSRLRAGAGAEAGLQIVPQTQARAGRTGQTQGKPGHARRPDPFVDESRGGAGDGTH